MGRYVTRNTGVFLGVGGGISNVDTSTEYSFVRGNLGLGHWFGPRLGVNIFYALEGQWRSYSATSGWTAYNNQLSANLFLRR